MLMASMTKQLDRLFDRVLRASARLNDTLLGIETDDRAFRAERDLQKPWPFAKRVGQPKHDDNFVYRAASYRTIRRVIRFINPSSNDVVYDIGAGKGRVICEFARLRIRKAVGVELNESLCNVARQNAERLRKRRAPIEIRCEDATSSDMSDGTLFFMFLPFGPETLKDVLQNLKRSLISHPRTIRIVYWRPAYKEVLESSDWLYQYAEMKTLRGDTILFWQSKAAAA